jgi:hypothetical protein
LNSASVNMWCGLFYILVSFLLGRCMYVYIISHSGIAGTGIWKND